ncbi:MAG: TIGR04282 family arsenosugar biosynthesis glycosyltransferase [Gammaproteobacteria bacterium]|nr:TIGR04282 family arsenosugar biosynthesis glycosyltransferase [Gammaproteobacteria bacterium]
MNATQSKGSIMVFVRAPIPGKTKTRLIPALGKKGAARLHASLIEQTLYRIQSVDDVNITLWCTPSTEDSYLQACAERYGIALKAQSGQDLGSRMQHAFETTLRSAPWTIILGTDCPDLETCDVQQAIDAMHNGADAVAGPAFDGGYYLLGLRRTSASLFRQMPWGTENVWEITRNRMEQLSWNYTTTTWHHDLDRPEDLENFPNLPDFLHNIHEQHEKQKKSV